MASFFKSKILRLTVCKALRYGSSVACLLTFWITSDTALAFPRDDTDSGLSSNRRLDSREISIDSQIDSLIFILSVDSSDHSRICIHRLLALYYLRKSHSNCPDGDNDCESDYRLPAEDEILYLVMLDSSVTPTSDDQVNFSEEVIKDFMQIKKQYVDDYIQIRRSKRGLLPSKPNLMKRAGLFLGSYAVVVAAGYLINRNVGDDESLPMPPPFLDPPQSLNPNSSFK